ncbi:glycosyltransferase family 2 protein [Herbiconiux sp. SYSU D00978]|uniref:glycosyltransferase family 2 protein n=1 Tax=Herbiconiux sp. SYSU D00978 TaxID=2812562 RepID=UPI001A977676|nr:glycosyltransferase [Herbiconiux sp. SYSU D00978]
MSTVIDPIDVFVPRSHSLAEIEQVTTYQRRHATIACIIPAYNEEETIAEVLRSLLAQTRPPEVIHVIVNNTTDNTVYEARQFEGEHKLHYRGTDYVTHVHVHDIGKNADRKVGALNFGWELSREYDFILGVDGDTTLDPKCVQWLEDEMTDDSRIGGLSAIYSIDDQKIKGWGANFLVAGQKAQFASFNMDNLVRNRDMAVLGGQCSLFRTTALKSTMEHYRQDYPWVRDSEVEDSLLSLQIKSVGFLTKISAHARANVGAMTTVRALNAQQIKWTVGAIELMRAKPFHPNLRLRWRENFQMLFNISTRVMFALLLVGSLSINAFVFNWVWLVPPVIAWLLNIRTMLSMQNRSAWDVIYAVLFFPAELYMWLRITHFVTSWYRSLARVEHDNWGAQASAESGSGSNGLTWPIIGAVVTAAVAIISWNMMDLFTRSLILALGWPLLSVFTVGLTVSMFRLLVRRHRGFKV